jgi:hypothetical protein
LMEINRTSIDGDQSRNTRQDGTGKRREIELDRIGGSNRGICPLH